MVNTKAVFHTVNDSDLSASTYNAEITDLKKEYGSIEQQEQRWKDFVDDFQQIEEHGNIPTISAEGSVPVVALGRGRVFAAADFVTGLIELNRMLFSRSSSSEAKRRVVYGSDSLV